VTWRPSRRFATQTALQALTLRFVGLLDDARLELGECGYDDFVSILTARIAREHRLRLDREGEGSS
jgi:hypothetical protein